MRRTLPRLAARGSSGSGGGSNAARTVSDATRFTQTTPHATSKPSTTGPSSKSAAAAQRSSRATPAASSSSRFPPPSSSAAARSADAGRGRRPSAAAAAAATEPAPLNETPEQKVARLRAAHLAAKNADVSGLDRFILRGRQAFDSAHKVTVMGLVGFTALAGLLTIYTSVDMMAYNRKRKAEFKAAQAKMDADSLEAARLAYMRGDATEDQIALVEEANAAAEAAGAQTGTHIFGQPQLPSALSTPGPSSSSYSDAAAAAPASTSTSAPDSTAGGSGAGGWRSWIFANLKNEEEGEDVGTSQRRLGYESLSSYDDPAIVRDSDVLRAIEDKQAYLREKAHEALEQEKENQRKGGPLDRVGIEGGEEKPAASDKKKWWFF